MAVFQNRGFGIRKGDFGWALRYQWLRFRPAGKARGREISLRQPIPHTERPVPICAPNGGLVPGLTPTGHSSPLLAASCGALLLRPECGLRLEGGLRPESAGPGRRLCRRPSRPSRPALAPAARPRPALAPAPRARHGSRRPLPLGSRLCRLLLRRVSAPQPLRPLACRAALDGPIAARAGLSPARAGPSAPRARPPLGRALTPSERARPTAPLAQPPSDGDRPHSAGIFALWVSCRFW